jgi:XTP/dITP diphosphohydrolase
VKIIVVTSNRNKAAEVAAFFKGVVEVGHIPLDIPEIRSDEVGEIARSKAEYAYGKLKIPLIVDDTSLSIEALNGFPGPYAAYVQQTIGNTGILNLMKGRQDRTARFTTAIAYADENGIHVFKGILDGRIGITPRGGAGFGYDPIFEIREQTLAEIRMEEKSRISHRAKALADFRDWFLQAFRDRIDANG